MKRGFARTRPADPPALAPSTIELPTPLKAPIPEGKPWWIVVLVIGMIGLMGGMVVITFASGARTFTGMGSIFPLVMVGGLMFMLFGGRFGGGQEMSKTKLDSLRARFMLVMDELRGTTAALADRLDENYRWYHPPPSTLEAGLGTGRMWERSAAGDDAWFGVTRVGVGMTDLIEAQAAAFTEPQDMPTDIELEPVTGKVLQEFVRYQNVAYGVPALVSLLVEPGYELRGPRGRVLGLIRAMLCQLVFFHGDDHLRLVVVTSDAAEWDWVKWLPHAGDRTREDGAGPVRMVYSSVQEFLSAKADTLLRGRGQFRARHAAAKDPIAQLPHTVVICDSDDGWERLGDRDGVDGVTFFDVRGTGSVPACRDPKRVLHIDADGVVVAVPRDATTWDAKDEQPRFFAVADQISRDEAEAFAERMARWRLAEAYEALETDDGARFLARDILTYYGIDDAADIDFAELWGPRSDINSRERLRVPIGNRANNKELLFLDMKDMAQEGDGPHGVMSGTTGSGKTTTLRTVITSLMLAHPPQNVQFVLADCKGGSGVKPFDGVPHVAHIITDLEDDQSLMGRFVDAMWGEIARRKAVCDSAGADDAVEYNLIRSSKLAAGEEPLPPLPVLVVVLDEFAEFFRMMPNAQEVLDQICRQGRSYWIHLLMASQTIDNRAEKLLENMGYRLVLRANTASGATLAGVPNAVNLPKKESGWGYLRLGSDATSDLTKFRAEFLWREYRKPGTEDLDDTVDPALSATYFAPQLFTTDFTPLPAADEEERANSAPVVIEPEDTDAEPAADEDDDSLMRPRVGRIIIDQLRQIDFEPHRLWQPPLDKPLSIDVLVNRHLGRRWDADYARTPDLVFPIGLVDRPFKHDQHPLTVNTAGSGANVVIIGAQGSGKTTALQSLICAAAMTHTPEQVQFYCLAFSSPALGSVAGLPHVGGVAQPLDRDGVRRTVAELVELLGRRKRSFEETGVMSMEVFRRRKAGAEAGPVPDDGHGDVYLVIDNYGGVALDYEPLLDEISKLINDGPTYGIHVVATVSRVGELRPQVRNGFGSRVELRLGDSTDAGLVKPRMAAEVPAGQPGRGMIAQNYTRMGVDPVGLHTLITRPALDGTDEALFDSRSVVEAVTPLAARFAPAPEVRRLTRQITTAELATAVAHDDSADARSMAWALSESRRPVYFDSPHLVITGQAKCGRTTACATLMREITRVYAPGAGEPARHADGPAAQVWLIDPRRQLLRILDSSYVHRFAYTVDTVKEMMTELAGVLAARQPQGGLSVDELAERRWTGPEIFVVIDDAQRLPMGFDSPLEPLAPWVEAAADVGLRIVYTRLFGGFMSAGADPVMRMMRQANAALLVMDSDPDEGYIQAKWRGHSMPPGRGFLMNTDEGGTYVQVAEGGSDDETR